MSPGCFRGVSRVFLASFTHKIVINKLIIMSKNPALLQKVFEDWLRLPERQELFAGLERSKVGQSISRLRLATIICLMCFN